MKKAAVIAGLAGLLLFSGTALADEAKNDGHSGHGTTQVQPAAKQEAVPSVAPVQTPAANAHEAHNMTPEEHKNMSTTPTTNTNSSTAAPAAGHSDTAADDHASHGSTADTTAGAHEESSSAGGHGGHENVVETPPNVPVLATFGAINAAFIMLGIWNKWFRKKEVLA